jgi:hypothetical protein
MKILTLENESFDLEHLPDEIDDMRFAIFDNSDPGDPDYLFGEYLTDFYNNFYQNEDIKKPMEVK